MISSQSVIHDFETSGALLHGHFKYTSGRHGSKFLQAARVLRNPDNLDRYSVEILDRIDESGLPVNVVIGPATGGILLANAVASLIQGCISMYTEKDGSGGQVLKRGFKLEPGSDVVIVEDITTTGGSVKAVADYIASIGSNVSGIYVLVDRSSGEAEKLLNYPFDYLARIDMESWDPSECPLCMNGVELVYPDEIVLNPVVVKQ